MAWITENPGKLFVPIECKPHKVMQRYLNTELSRYLHGESCYNKNQYQKSKCLSNNKIPTISTLIRKALLPFPTYIKSY